MLEDALEEHEAELLDSARAFVVKLGLAKRPARVKEMAREVFQNAAEKVLEKAHKYDPDQPPRPWLRSFIFNAARTLRKKRERRESRMRPVHSLNVPSQASENRTLTEEDLFAWVAKEAGQVDFDDGKDSRIEWIREHAQEKDRAVLELRLKGYTGEELAVELGKELQTSLTAGAAATRLYRATQRLANAFQNQTR